MPVGGIFGPVEQYMPPAASSTSSTNAGGSMAVGDGWYVNAAGYLFNKSGQMVRRLDQTALDFLKVLDPDQLKRVSFDGTGRPTVTGDGSGGNSPGTKAPAPSTSGGGSSGRIASGGGGGYGGGGGGGGGSSGSGGGGYHVTNESQGGGAVGGGIVPPIGGAPPPIGGETPINGNTPINVKDPGARNMPLGSYFQPQPGFGGRMPSLFDGLPANPTMADILGAVTRRQEAGLQGRLDLLGGVFNESLNSPNSMAQRSLVQRLLQNPETMDEATIQRITGQNNQAIGNRASVLAQAAGDRAASMGVGRDQGQFAQDRIYRSAANQQSEGERDTRIKAAIQNGQDIRSALQVGGNAIQQDQGMRRDIVGEAQRAIGESQVYGDTFVTNAMLGGANPNMPKAPVQYPNTQYTYGRY